MKYKEYKGINYAEVADEVLEFWKKNDIFNKSVDQKEGAETFMFFEGPPSANGVPGIHHVMGRAIKDIFCRYKTQKGFQVKRKAGWDTHGLPVELGVEKELGITKEDIGKKISVEDYNDACRKAVMKYTDIWNDLTEKMGYWVDMKDPYITYKPKYMESVWWLLKQIFDKGLIYKGYSIQPYSPKAGTGLSSNEVNQPGAYQDVTDTTVIGQFKAIPETVPSSLNISEDLYLLAWTTTPWTLPSNTALTVGPKIDYVVVKTFNQYTFEPIQVVLAKSLVAKQFAGKKFNQVEGVAELDSYSKGDKQIPYYIATECKGADLIGIRYEQLLPFALPYENSENAFRVIGGDFVTTEDGTGIVHTAPTFGADDAMAAKQAKPEIPPMLVKDEDDNLVPLVDLQGRFRPEVGEFAGMYVKNEYYNEGEAPDKSVDVQIAIRLKEENKAFKVEKYVHSYPHCWRTDKPILYYPLDSWFIKVTDKNDRMYDLNTTINWKPESTGTGRFGNWLQNANDWNLSRSRYWGIPLPIWKSEDGKELKMIGSLAELKEEIQKSIAAGFMDSDIYSDFVVGDMSEENYDKVDLHKNIVDQITLVSETGKPMRRESDLIDVWFDSGSMPYAQWHYPFENKEAVDDGLKTADFIAEGVDQTRGWFYTLHAIATMVFDGVAYKNVVSNGLVLDKNGQKMSKRLGNAVDPFTTLSKYGPDATRWYMISNANPWDNLKFDLEGVAEVQRRFFGTFFNTYNFFALYANLDGFDFKEQAIPIEKRTESDRWIISKLNSLTKKVDDAFNDYEPTKAARLIQDFVIDDLSNWYVRLNRKRFWKGEYNEDKKSAYQSLYTCLLTVAKLGAPIAPFFLDKVYGHLNEVSGQEEHDSVHLSKFPEADESLIDEELEARMEMAQKVSSLVHSLRKKEKLKVRQPLSKIMIPVMNENTVDRVKAVEELILTEVNIKAVELIDDTSGVLVKSIKPNFKKLGKQYGPRMKDISKAIAGFSADDISQIEKENKYALDLGDTIIELTLEDVLIASEDIPGWLVASEGGLTVALDINITDDLKKEGIARDIVNRVQNLRKDNGLEVQDRIKIQISSEDSIVTESVKQFEEYLCIETQANNLLVVDNLADGEELDIDDLKIQVKIEVN
ncbi:isoleucine--tRNA ligase [Reichenbachiella versicolor]|uniref:isoleucine--tRNA ligase n=1 Tax=Reichenbachiella versicolor TaxID=1821036 RepID=UPI000D6E18C0|nr:isoleucine--tRNA ligase [Reichenbachiella versicolor]